MVNNIDWDKLNLIPAIVQEEKSGKVLMLAYMNRDALELTIKTNYAHYFSRSRQKLWKKGESSGNLQEVKEILLDCDNDTILLKVVQIGGVACHTGRKSCFYKNIQTSEITTNPTVQIDYGVVDKLYHTILEKKFDDPSTSYTAKLFKKGENTILKKVVEEAGEFCFAIKDDNRDEIIYEATDLLYHSLVALGLKNINPDLIKQELARRVGISGIEEKNSRKD